MRRISAVSFGVASLFLLNACASQQSALPIQGEVVSCNSITTNSSQSGVTLPCMDGKTSMNFGAVRGPLIVNVWGSWCAPCKEEIPFFRSFYAKNQIQILGVDVEEAAASDGTQFVLENGMTWPSVVDPDGRSRALFGMGVPVTWFIDRNGAVVHKKIGVLRSEAELRQLARDYLHLVVN